MWLAHAVLLAATLMSYVSLVSVQLTCSEDEQCHKDHFCEKYECHKCLSCQELKRELPSSSSSCIKSVAQCGPCLKGLVVNRNGDINCVPPSQSDSADSDTNTAIWVAGAIVITLLIIVAVAIVYRVSKTRLFKLQSNADTDTILPTRIASAPEPPPPYNLNIEPHHPEDTSYPLIKPGVPLFAPPTVESQGNQRAGVFNLPAYVRYSSPASDVSNDVNDNYYAALGQDENTMESTWTPQPSNSKSTTVPEMNESAASAQPQRRRNEESSSSLSTALAIARDTDLVQPPPKRLRTQDVNGNNGSNSDDENSDNALQQGSSRVGRQNIVLNVQINNNL